MVTVPIALLLLVGIVISLTRGKGTALFGVMCLLLGVTVANTEIGQLLVQVTEAAVGAASNAGTSAGLGG